MSHVRYALYLAPPPDSDLWRFGCNVVGRDASTGVACHGFAPEGHEPDSWRSLTSEPRRYGFHATLAAPFRLRADLNAADLMDRVEEFARAFKPFDAGDLHVAAMTADDGRAFVVLKPDGDLRVLHSFEEAAVRALYAVRAPPTREERARRNSAGLTPRQRYYLEAWGYPYVLDEFRPHFTLTNPLPDPVNVVKALEWEFSLRAASRALQVDDAALFGETAPGGEFNILRRFPLGRAKRARRLSSRVAVAAFID
jgi:hypothetical protein